MRSICGIFGDYLQVYTSVPQYRHLPIAEGIDLEWMGNAFYRRGKGAGSSQKRIDIYRINNEPLSEILEASLNIRRKNPQTKPKDINRITDKKKAIFYFLKDDIPKRAKDEIKRNVRKDVAEYAEDTTTAKIGENDHVNVSTAEPLIAKTSTPLIVGGKGEFVEGCLWNYNLDWSFSCISHMVPPGKIDDYPYLSWSPQNECAYCYAKRANNDPVRIRRFERDMLKEQIFEINSRNKEKGLPPMKLLRVGKLSEPGHPWFMEHNIQFLELAEEMDFRTVIVTKYIPFNTKLKNRLVKTESMLQFSIGYDELEPGAVLWGADNETRFQTALEYRRKGVDVVFRLVREAPEAPDELAMRVMNAWHDAGIPTLFTPLYIDSKKVAESLGKDWNTLKSEQQSLFCDDKSAGTYIQKNGSSNRLIPRTLHPFYRERFQDNSLGLGGICRQVGEDYYCRQCCIGEGSVANADDVEKKVIYKNKNGSRKGKWREKNSNRNQMGLFEK